MKALCWQGKHEVQVKNVHEARLINPRDGLIKVTSTAICGSDLHLYDGYIPTLEKGDILGHECMGEVVAIGSEVKMTAVGDKVVIPFDLACGSCHHCFETNFSGCENTNPNGVMADKIYGHSGAAMLGYSHMFGGYAGGQAEYVRVPFIDTNSLKVPDGISDEKVLFLSDIFPTGYMAAENCGLKGGETVAVWGCGPVGQFAIRSAYMLGAEQVIAIDHHPARLDMATQGGALALNYENVESLSDQLSFLTGGRGPDACIDAVGMEAHGTGIAASYDHVKASVGLATDRIDALRQALQACAVGGTVSVPGVYGGFVDKLPLGAAFGKGVTIKMGQTHTQRYMQPLLDRILNDEIDPSFVITHRLKLDDAAEGYATFKEKQNECIKVVMHLN